ncbi:MAG TPA: molecular chaperone DnaK [Myxococcota bacterium]|mgnify:FL=1|nr:molecular chaperone DnaK [Myxococcota bacterium]HQK51081.1 molecular chaperone DnaK [Myxococcota bacterium]
MGKVIGIDLGTTNSCVAVMEGGNPVVIPNLEGSRTTPSVVAIGDDGERLVGAVAKRQAITNAQNTVFAVKRLMGRKYDSPEVQRVISSYPYKIVRAANGDAAVELAGRQLSPPEISAVILSKMREYAEEYLGETVTDAVITVPAYFDDTQRQATRDAGRIAGLNVLRIINEPTAAALAHGLSRRAAGRIAVYDLGGGTFDISVMEVGEGVFQVKTTHGDTFLGGEDIDARIVDLLATQFMKMHGVDLREDVVALQRLRDAAEKAKIDLSTAREVDINLPFIHADTSGPKHIQVTLTRAQLEALVDDIISRTIDHCRQALADAGVEPRELDEVLLVGGMTKMPLVQQKVASFFGMQPSRGVNPDEAVAVGAAIQAGILQGDMGDVVLLDVVPLSLGIETQGGIFTPLIERNTAIPCSVTEVFTTAEDYQPLVNIHVLQGERPLARDNKSLARFELLGIPPARRGIPKIEVAFEVDVNGILNVSARDLGTGNVQTVRVRPTSGLSERDIERILAEAAESAREDASRQELANLKNRADGLMYTTERSLEEFLNYLTDEEIARIHADLEACRKARNGNDPAAIIAAIKNLEKSSYRIAELMYRDASG